MTDTLPKIRQFLESTNLEFEVMHCDPKLADTNVFCRKYGVELEDSVNAIVVKTKTGELKYAECALLATTKLDINKTVRKKLGARKVSFANIEETSKLTAMEIGGVTPLLLPDFLPLWISSRGMCRNRPDSKILISLKNDTYSTKRDVK